MHIHKESHPRNPNCPPPEPSVIARPRDRFLRDVARNALRDLETWYPPLIVNNNPTIRAALTVLFPPLGNALELGHRLFETGKRALKSLFKSSTL